MTVKRKISLRYARDDGQGRRPAYKEGILLLPNRYKGSRLRCLNQSSTWRRAALKAAGMKGRVRKGRWVAQGAQQVQHSAANVEPTSARPAASSRHHITSSARTQVHAEPNPSTSTPLKGGSMISHPLKPPQIKCQQPATAQPDSTTQQQPSNSPTSHPHHPASPHPPAAPSGPPAAPICPTGSTSDR